MARLDLTVFGGLIPKASARALNPNAGQIARNLSVHVNEFRPVGSDDTPLAVSGVTNPKTIWRFQYQSDGTTLNTVFSTSGTWRIHAAERSYAKWPGNATDLDKHIMTTDDGTVVPKWADCAGTERQLGVPKPATAPTVTLVAVEEFTTEERATALDTAKAGVLAAFRENATAVWVGAPDPGTSTPGYAKYLTLVGDDEQMMIARAYKLTGENGTVADTYSGDGEPEDFAWIFDPSLGGFAIQSSGSPDWADPPNTWHWVIPIPAFGMTYDLDEAAASTAIEAIALPGGTGGQFLFTSDQADDLIALVNEYVSPTGTYLKPKIDALRAKSLQAVGIFDGTGKASLTNMTQAFYALPAVDNEIEVAITRCCEDVWTAAYNAARTVFTTYDPAGDPGGAPP